MREFEYPEKYKDISDEKLVCLCREGVQDAFAALSVRFIFVLKNKSEELKGNGVEPEDLFQEGLIGLNDAVVSFDENGGAAFRTYAGVCIRNRMISAVRKANSSGNLITNSALPLSEQTDAPSAYYTEPEKAFAAREKLRDELHYMTGKSRYTNWNNIKLRTYAEKYLRKCGLSAREILRLKKNLSKSYTKK